MKKHLKEIAKIINKFKQKYKFIEVYLKIEGVVIYNVHTMLKVKCQTEFDDYTIEQVKKIRGDIYEQIRQYLSLHSIKQSLYIQTESRSWGMDGQIIYFKEQLKV